MSSVTIKLKPSEAHHFETKWGTFSTVSVVNENEAASANFSAACSTATPTPFKARGRLVGNEHWTSAPINFGGGQLFVVNTTNPSEPSVIKVTFN